MGAKQPFKIPDNVDVLTEVKKYGTDISLYLACQELRILWGHAVPLKYRVKAVLRYPFHEHHSDTAELFDPHWNSHRVPKSLQPWLRISFPVVGALRTYLAMIYSQKKVPIRKTTKNLFREMLSYIETSGAEHMCTAMEILKHMQRAGTIKRILPRMRKSKLFGVGFLHAWFTGSLCQYLDKFYEKWDWKHTEWLQTLLSGLTEKDFNKILTSLPWTRAMFLLDNLSDDKITWSYAFRVLPSCLCERPDTAVPSLLSLCLARVVQERSNFFEQEYEVHELSLFEQLTNNIPHDLAEAIPLILLLSQRQEYLVDQSLILMKVLNTAFGWFARKQLLKCKSVPVETMIELQKHGPPLSDAELMHFAQQTSEYEINEFLSSVQDIMSERQVNLLRRYSFRWDMQQLYTQNSIHTAKRLKMTVDEFVEWTQFDTAELRDIYLEDPSGY